MFYLHNRCQQNTRVQNLRHVCVLQGRVKQIVGSSLKDLPKLRQDSI